MSIELQSKVDQKVAGAFLKWSLKSLSHQEDSFSPILFEIFSAENMIGGKFWLVEIELDRRFWLAESETNLIIVNIKIF